MADRAYDRLSEQILSSFKVDLIEPTCRRPVTFEITFCDLEARGKRVANTLARKAVEAAGKYFGAFLSPQQPHLRQRLQLLPGTIRRVNRSAEAYAKGKAGAVPQG